MVKCLVRQLSEGVYREMLAEPREKGVGDSIEIDVGYQLLQRFKEQAHGCSRRMSPTVPEPPTGERVVGCATESEIRIRTPPWQGMKPAISVGGRTGSAHNPTVWCDELETSSPRSARL